MAESERPLDIIELDLGKAAKPIHQQYLDLAKKGLADPRSLNPNEIWHICRAFVFYSAQLDGLLGNEGQGSTP